MKRTFRVVVWLAREDPVGIGDFCQGSGCHDGPGYIVAGWGVHLTHMGLEKWNFPVTTRGKAPGKETAVKCCVQEAWCCC
jgi:hypothetical protein